MGVRNDVAPDERACRIFLTVVQCCGYTDAAVKLSAMPGEKKYSRQSVGQAIDRIRHWFGGEPLFGRHNGRLTLTVRGKEFELAARNVMDEYRQMRGEAGEGSKLP